MRQVSAPSQESTDDAVEGNPAGIDRLLVDLRAPGTTSAFPFQSSHDSWSELTDQNRKLEYVAECELMLCLFHAVLENEGIETDEALTNGIYRIGFIRLTQNARERLQAPLRSRLETQMLRRIVPEADVLPLGDVHLDDRFVGPLVDGLIAGQLRVEKPIEDQWLPSAR